MSVDVEATPRDAGERNQLFRSPVTEQLKTGEVSLDDVIQYQCAVPEKINALISDQMKLYEDLRKVSERIGEHHYWTNNSEGKDIQLQLAKMRSEIATLASPSEGARPCWG